jgi:N-acetylglucosaminyldiphosphoundecaprenol N-acetyl-beta-D-mannosaminyltransferase
MGARHQPRGRTGTDLPLDREAGGGELTVDRVDILGVRVSAIDMAAAVNTISSWVATGERTYVCVSGVHGIMESQKDSELRDIHNASGLTVPDGMPLVWLGRRAGATWMDRVYGPDLLLKVLETGLDAGWRHYFYGGANGVAAELVDRLATRFRGLRTVGSWSPPFRELTEAEIREVAERINAAQPDVIWVGLSTPKQEKWMARIRPLLAAPVLIGVGAAFDMHSGRLKQAPRWMQKRGLEWFYRLLKEPRRLWRRYLGNNPRFLWAVAWRRPTLIREPPAGRGLTTANH